MRSNRGGSSSNVDGRGVGTAGATWTAGACGLQGRVDGRSNVDGRGVWTAGACGRQGQRGRQGRVDGRGVWKAEEADTRGKGGGEAGRGYPHNDKDPTVPTTSGGLYPTGQQVTSFNLVSHIMGTHPAYCTTAHKCKSWWVLRTAYLNPPGGTSSITRLYPSHVDGVRIAPLFYKMKVTEDNKTFSMIL